MLKKSQRLITREFDLVFSNNKTKHGDSLILLSPTRELIHKHPSLENKFAVVVSKKICRRRVDRNAIRRSIYRAVENLINSGEIDGDSGAIIMLKKKRGCPTDRGEDNWRSELRQLFAID